MNNIKNVLWESFLNKRNADINAKNIKILLLEGS
jgi:hypothetical protein